MRRALAPIAALVLVLGTVGSAAASSDASDDHAKLYYVSVGDSLAAGVQPIGDPDNLYRTADGYAEQLLAIGRARLPKLSLVKLACPGETTARMIGGGICSYPHGSQLDEAVSFLHAHRNHVAFVTIDIGANDFPCNEARCVPEGVASIQANLPGILDDLRNAAGPGVPIVGMRLYNPFLAAWLLGAEGQAYAQYTEIALMGADRRDAPRDLPSCGRRCRRCRRRLLVDRLHDARRHAGRGPGPPQRGPDLHLDVGLRSDSPGARQPREP